MRGLEEFQDGFARALVSVELPSGLPPDVERVARQPAFSVYRNTVLKGWVDALEANFPAVVRLVGEEWFRAAAAVYARANPPRTVMMVSYGDSFAAFLETFEPAAELPYLPAVARLDRLWTEAHVAADAPVLDAGTFAAMAPEALAATVGVLHPSARIAWCGHTAPSIWLDARGLTPEVHEIAFEARGEGVLLVRAGGPVETLKLTAGGFAFLDASARGLTLAEACGAALAEEPSLDLASLTAALIEVGAFSVPRASENSAAERDEPCRQA